MKNLAIKAFTGIALASFALALIMIIWNWGALPDEVPTHYGINGEPDSWGHKGFIFIAPIIGIVLWGFLRATRHVASLNIPGVSNDKPMNEQQKIAANHMMIIMSNVLLLFLSFMSIKDTYNATGGNLSLGYWEMIIFFAALLLPLVLYSIRIYRLGKLDI